MSKIYTRTGDSGESSVRDERLRKDALVFDVLGDLDELNSWLGVLKGASWVRESVQAPWRSRGFIEEIQVALMALSADIAGYGTFSVDLVKRLEDAVDALSPQGTFSLRLPEGHVHVVRTVCRRAERRLVAFDNHHPGLPFLNRLSDYLYVLALNTTPPTCG